MLKSNKKYQRKFLKKKLKKENIFEWRTNKLKFGNFGLMSLEKGFINEIQILAISQIIRKLLKREGHFWVRVDPIFNLTKKPLESRMGKGKGNIDVWGFYIKTGQILVEITGVSFEKAKTILEKSSGKLPVKNKFIFRKFK